MSGKRQQNGQQGAARTMIPLSCWAKLIIMLKSVPSCQRKCLTIAEPSKRFLDGRLDPKECSASSN